MVGANGAKTCAHGFARIGPTQAGLCLFLRGMSNKNYIQYIRCKYTVHFWIAHSFGIFFGLSINVKLKGAGSAPPQRPEGLHTRVFEAILLCDAPHQFPARFRAIYEENGYAQQSL